jgi:hypothetical protein
MYAVDWELSASREFAVISMLHSDRWNDLNAADNDIEKKLRSNPLKYSQPVSEGLHRIVSSPLAVFFSIDGTQVHVEAVGWIG